MISGFWKFCVKEKGERRGVRNPNSETLRIVREHLSNNGYSLAFNNCEHFATYCATGKKRSTQVRNIVGGIVGVAFAVTATVIRKKITRKQEV